MLSSPGEQGFVVVRDVLNASEAWQLGAFGENGRVLSPSQRHMVWHGWHNMDLF